MSNVIRHNPIEGKLSDAVEHNGVIISGRHSKGRIIAITRHIHRVRLLAQPLGEHSRRRRFVLHEQYAHRAVVRRIQVRVA